jgi:hypothetical protein
MAIGIKALYLVAAVAYLATLLAVLRLREASARQHAQDLAWRAAAEPAA